MGLSDHGNDPVTLAQTRCPCARVRGSDHDFVAIVVHGGADFAVQLDFVGMRAFGLADHWRRRRAC